MVTPLDLAATGDAHTRRTLTALSLAVAKSKRIVVVTGAGISCSSGIPDFRSSDGLYNLVKQRYPDVVLKGRDLFDASLFRDPISTSVFYTFVSELKSAIDAASPARTHHFIKTLDSKRRLLRSYTQNIDGLEERVGLAGSSSETVRSAGGKGKEKIRAKSVRNVQLHGDIHRVRCTFCSAEYACTSSHLETFGSGNAPDCPDCTTRSKARVARSARALKIGTLRPAIVLYDEPHPLGDDIGLIQTADINKKPDMLIIMGTSLKVHGLKKLVKEFARAVRDHNSPRSSSPDSSQRQDGKTAKPAPAKAATKASPKNAKNILAQLEGRVVFVNRTPPGSEWDGIIDYWVHGDTDAWSERVEEDWRRMRPSDWEVQRRLDGDDGFKTVKPNAIAAVTAGKPKPQKKPVGGKDDAGVEDENVPPPPAAAVEPPPLMDFAPAKPTSSVPSTPSKRRKNATQYNASGDDTDVECSPSKRHASGGRARSLAKRGSELLTPATSVALRVKKMALDGDQSMHMPDEARGLLFRDATNAPTSAKGVQKGAHVDFDADAGSSDVEDNDVPLKHARQSKPERGRRTQATNKTGPVATRPFRRTASGRTVEVVIPVRS